MDLKTISATLALLGSGALLSACDSKDAGAQKAKKAEPAKEVGATPSGNASKDGAEAEGEMACAPGKCGAGACGAKKDDGTGKDDPQTAHAKGDSDAKDALDGGEGAGGSDAPEDKT